MSDYFILDIPAVNQLFVDFRKMDVLLTKHRKGIDVMDSRDIEDLKTKRLHYRQVMITLGIMDAYYAWVKEMGIE